MAFKEFAFTWTVKDLELLEDDSIESPKFRLPLSDTQISSIDYCLNITFRNYSKITVRRCDNGNVVSSGDNRNWNYTLTATRSDVEINVSSMNKVATDIYKDILVVKCLFKSGRHIFSEKNYFVTSELAALKCTAIINLSHISCYYNIQNYYASQATQLSIIPEFKGINTEISYNRRTNSFSNLRVFYTPSNTTMHRIYVTVYNVTTSSYVSRFSISSPSRDSNLPNLPGVSSAHTLSISNYFQEGDKASRIKHYTDVAPGALLLVDSKETKSSNQNVSTTPTHGTVMEAMHQLYTKQSHFDFTLKAGGRSFPVHKAILSVRSPVFEAMLSNDMKERKDNTVDVTDIDDNTMDAFLKYVYYENVELRDFEFCVKLYTAADKYEVSALRDKCIHYMQLHFSLDNVCDVLQLAHACNDEQLKQKIMNFVSKNWKSIAPSAQFKQLMANNLELAAKVMHETVLKTL